MIDRGAVSLWLESYVRAWETYDAGAIGDLFSVDAAYYYHPYDEPVRGRAAIVQSWLENADTPGTYRASYTPIAVDGDTAVATGTSEYLRGEDGRVQRQFHNIFIIRFDGEGRCAEFREYFMQTPDAPSGSPV